MQLNLKNPIVFFDLETTGVNIATDRIVEISYLKVYPNGKEECKTLRINPGIPIPPESTAVHGISDADVANCPTFKEVAKRSLVKLRGAIWLVIIRTVSIYLFWSKSYCVQGSILIFQSER